MGDPAGWGTLHITPPSGMSQNQTVKCTLLLSINRDATLKKTNKKK